MFSRSSVPAFTTPRFQHTPPHSTVHSPHSPIRLPSPLTSKCPHVPGPFHTLTPTSPLQHSHTLTPTLSRPSTLKHRHSHLFPTPSLPHPHSHLTSTTLPHPLYHHTPTPSLPPHSHTLTLQYTHKRTPFTPYHTPTNSLLSLP